MHGSRLKINRRHWRVEVRPRMRCDGACDPPVTPGKCIAVSEQAIKGDRRLMDTLIHEFLHANDWHMRHPTVKRLARELTRLLHDVAGFRRA